MFSIVIHAESMSVTIYFYKYKKDPPSLHSIRKILSRIKLNDTLELFRQFRIEKIEKRRVINSTCVPVHDGVSFTVGELIYFLQRPFFINLDNERMKVTHFSLKKLYSIIVSFTIGITCLKLIIYFFTMNRCR